MCVCPQCALGQSRQTFLKGTGMWGTSTLSFSSLLTPTFPHDPLPVVLSLLGSVAAGHLVDGVSPVDLQVWDPSA